jgi:hypothetical protein
MSNMQQIKMKWTGIRPILMHNGRLSDPLDDYVKKQKDIRADKVAAKTDAGTEKLMRLEWEGGLYWSDKFGPVIPSDNIESCIQLGSRRLKLGKIVAAAVFCTEPEVKLEYDGPRSLEKLYATPGYSLRKSAKVGQSRVMRVRPMFPTGWSITFELEFDGEAINSTSLQRCCVEAGSMIGLGDWRPKFGRFLVEVLK